MADQSGAGPRLEQLLLQFITRLNLLLASNRELHPILAGILEETKTLFGADEGCIRLSDPGDRAGVTIVRKAVQSGSWPRPIAISVMGFIEGGHPVLMTPDLSADPRFPGLSRVESRIRAVIAVPLTAEGRTTGILAVSDARPGRAWTDRDVELLSMVAQRSGEAIERARMREQIQRMEEGRIKAERVRQEMLQVQRMQLSFVPSEPLRVPGWELSGTVVPALQVGGDLFDYFPTGDGFVGLAVADVEGKGLPAAVIMALVKGALIEIGRARLAVGEAMAHVNRAVASIGSIKTVTMFYGELELATGILRYSNGGHPPPLVRRRDGRVEVLSEGGPIFGVLRDFDYPQGEARLGPGESLLVYSDGVTEALDGSRALFGEERLRDAWSEVGGLRAGVALDRVLRAVEAFRGTAPQSDDITLVLMSGDGG